MAYTTPRVMSKAVKATLSADDVKLFDARIAAGWSEEPSVYPFQSVRWEDTKRFKTTGRAPDSDTIKEKHPSGKAPIGFGDIKLSAPTKGVTAVTADDGPHTLAGLPHLAQINSYGSIVMGPGGQYYDGVFGAKHKVPVGVIPAFGADGRTESVLREIAAVAFYANRENKPGRMLTETEKRMLHSLLKKMDEDLADRMEDPPVGNLQYYDSFLATYKLFKTIDRDMGEFGLKKGRGEAFDVALAAAEKDSSKTALDHLMSKREDDKINIHHINVTCMIDVVGKDGVVTKQPDTRTLIVFFANADYFEYVEKKATALIRREGTNVQDMLAPHEAAWSMCVSKNSKEYDTRYTGIPESREAILGCYRRKRINTRSLNNGKVTLDCPSFEGVGTVSSLCVSILAKSFLKAFYASIKINSILILAHKPYVSRDECSIAPPDEFDESAETEEEIADRLENERIFAENAEKEKAERKAKEKAEREAKEKAEREAREKQEVRDATTALAGEDEVMSDASSPQQGTSRSRDSFDEDSNEAPEPKRVRQ